MSHLPGTIHEWSYLSRRCISLWAARRAFLAAAAREDAGPPPSSGGAFRVALSWRHASAIRLLQPPARKIASTTLFLPNMLSTNTLYLMMLETGGRRKLAFNCKSQLCGHTESLYVCLPVFKSVSRTPWLELPLGRALSVAALQQRHQPFAQQFVALLNCCPWQLICLEIIC